MSTLVFKERDEFRREQIADRVIQLLTSDINVSPMIVDGDWGTGKTEFCHKLINKFKESHSNYRLLYVDAFQADHADNPLMTVLSSVMTLLPEGSKKKTLLQKAVPVMRYGLATAVKAVISHTLKQNTENLADGLEDHLQDAADKAIDASVTALLKDHEKAQENLQALQTTLEGITKEAPIVIFIDELDRCRPDFAVQMLEIIKHTFDVKGVQFVLVTNTKQLKAAINHRYGHQVEAQRYLDKFLKFSFQLPEITLGNNGYKKGQVLAAVDYFQNLIRCSGVLQNTSLTTQESGVFAFAQALIEINNLSLREVEAFVRHLEISQTLHQNLNSRSTFGAQLLRVFGVYLFCFASNTAESIQKNKVNAQEIAEILGMKNKPDYKVDSYQLSHTDVIAVLLAQTSTFNNESYQPQTEEERSYWSETRQEFFRPDLRHNGNIFEFINETIMSLRLGGRI